MTDCAAALRCNSTSSGIASEQLAANPRFDLRELPQLSVQGRGYAEQVAEADNRIEIRHICQDIGAPFDAPTII